MPVIRGVGTNPHSTPKKQAALDGLAGHLLGSVVAVAQNCRTDAVVIDMTCGPGIDGATGAPGSPLILARHLTRLREKGYSATLVCVDRVPKHLKALEAAMQKLCPELPVRYERSQSAALEGLSTNTVGLAYFDPTKYTDLDVDLLRYMGQRFARLDILFTRNGLAYARMKGANHTATWALGIEDYLAATGKRCRYIVEYAAYNWWSFGFADNWITRPAAKLRWPDGKLLPVDSQQGRTLLDRLMMKRQKDEQPCEQLTLFGFDE